MIEVYDILYKGIAFCGVFILIFLIIYSLVFKFNKCKFKGMCKYYNEHSIVCNKTAGNYYGKERKAGCYRDLDKQNDRIGLLLGFLGTLWITWGMIDKINTLGFAG